jgi:hypothetical protein
LYRAGNSAGAAARFREALELDSQSELAASYLELAEDRLRQSRRRNVPSVATPVPGEELRISAADLPRARPTPGTARLTVYFNSPLNAGSIVVVVDGETLSEIPFDHTRHGFLGIRREGSGIVKRVLLIPSGAREVTVTLNGEKSGTIGTKTFRESLSAGSDWTLRIDQADRSSPASFFLVRTSR